jgi:hypothetical protein
MLNAARVVNGGIMVASVSKVPEERMCTIENDKGKATNRVKNFFDKILSVFRVKLNNNYLKTGARSGIG